MIPSASFITSSVITPSVFKRSNSTSKSSTPKRKTFSETFIFFQKVEFKLNQFDIQ